MIKQHVTFIKKGFLRNTNCGGQAMLTYRSTEIIANDQATIE